MPEYKYIDYLQLRTIATKIQNFSENTKTFKLVIIS